MKKGRAAILWAACLLLLAACASQGGEPVETSWRVDQMAGAIWSVQQSQDVLEPHGIFYGDPDFAGYLQDSMGIDPADVIDGAILYAGGVNAQEIAVLRLMDGADGDGVVKALEAYIESRAGAFAGYAPEQYAILENASAVRRGQYAALLIAPDQDEAVDAFAACFTSPAPEDVPLAAPDLPPAVEEPEPEPVQEPEQRPELEPEQDPEPQTEPEMEPGTAPEVKPDPEPETVPVPDPDPVPELPREPWVYDQSRIAAAWNSGEREGLYPEDLEILTVLEGIPALSDQTLTAYEKELALHDWMIAWAEYDPGALSSGPVGTPIPHNDNPYGLLVGKKAICTGYSHTFALLMALAGIECVTVPGTAHGGSDEHAWNLVKLDGEWYAVDTTWDDPVASFVIPVWMAHKYFNVISSFLRENDRSWDESAYPEATGTDYAWMG